MRLIAYIRVSTDRQELGPEAQLEELHRWASVAGHEIVDVARDIGVSGATPFAKRPALNRAIACIPERCDGICVTKRDRLARDVLEAIMIDRVVEKLGGRVMLANGRNDEDPDTILMRRMHDAFAEYERAMIRFRIRAAFAVKRARSEALGGTSPYGWKIAPDGKTLIKDAREQEVLRRIAKAHDDGMSYESIADNLNRQKVPARKRSGSDLPGKWNKKSVMRFIQRFRASRLAEETEAS